MCERTVARWRPPPRARAAGSRRAPPRARAGSAPCRARSGCIRRPHGPLGAARWGRPRTRKQQRGEGEEQRATARAGGSRRQGTRGHRAARRGPCRRRHSRGALAGGCGSCGVTQLCVRGGPHGVRARSRAGLWNGMWVPTSRTRGEGLRGRGGRALGGVTSRRSRKSRDFAPRPRRSRRGGPCAGGPGRRAAEEAEAGSLRGTTRTPGLDPCRGGQAPRWRAARPPQPAAGRGCVHGAAHPPRHPRLPHAVPAVPADGCTCRCVLPWGC